MKIWAAAVPIMKGHAGSESYWATDAHGVTGSSALQARDQS